MVFSLPEGLLKTNPEIYSVLARYPVIPTEEVIQCSNVYSTLHQTFDDSTSARAKNFWRRVEGQQLSGPAVAKLFREFLSSQTFDPLKRIKGQDDEPLVLQDSQKEPPGEVDVKPPKESNQEMDPKPPEQPKEGEGLECNTSTTNTKPPAPLSSRPVPPRSILKRNQGEPIPEPAAQPTEAMLELEAKRVAELAAQRAAQIAADLEAELANQPTPSEVPVQTQIQVGFCPLVRSSSTTKMDLRSPGGSEGTATPSVASSAYGGEPSTPREQNPTNFEGPICTPNNGDASSQRRVSFLDALPGASPPRRDPDPDATTTNQYTVPMDRFGPRIGYVPQRVERSGLLLTGRVVNGSSLAPT